MCLIIDANVAAEVFRPDPSDEMGPVRTALRERKATAVYGGKLAEEYAKLHRLRSIILEYDRRGVLRIQDRTAVERETERVRETRLCTSDDEHIIGLARVANVRLLCSRDTDLHQDFKNPALLKPRGSIYQNASHADLIREHCG